MIPVAVAVVGRPVPGSRSSTRALNVISPLVSDKVETSQMDGDRKSSESPSAPLPAL